MMKKAPAAETAIVNAYRIPPCSSQTPAPAKVSHISIIPFLVQLIDEPVLVIGRTASRRPIGTSSPVVRANAHVAAFVEEAVEERHA